MKKLIWGAIYLLSFLLSFAISIAVTLLVPREFAGIPRVSWDDSMGTVLRDIPYASGALNKFDLFLPADRKRATKLVVYIHAGGFTSGDKADDENMGKFFASKGYVGATINYSLRNETNDANVKQMSVEIREGIADIVAAAAGRGYSLNGMAVAGGSAGGALAMIYAYRDGPRSPLPVNMVMSLVGPASFDPVVWGGLNDGFASVESANAGAAFVTAMTGEAVTADMMRSGAYKKILEPITATALVSGKAPPTLVAYGALDKVAPFAASRGLLDALKRHRIPHDALVFPNSGHGLNRDPELAELLGVKIEEYLQRYLPLY